MLLLYYLEQLYTVPIYYFYYFSCFRIVRFSCSRFSWTNDIWISGAKLLYCVVNKRTLQAMYIASIAAYKVDGRMRCRCSWSTRSNESKEERSSSSRLVGSSLSLSFLSHCWLTMRLFVPLFFHVIFPTCTLFEMISIIVSLVWDLWAFMFPVGEAG